VRELFLKKTRKVPLSIGVQITMIHCVVYLLLIFKMVHGLMNNPVYKMTKTESLDTSSKHMTSLLLLLLL
jgi:hypothetical protein